MLIATLLFLTAGLALAWVAVVDRNIAAGLFSALALLIAREAAWLAFAIWRDRRDLRLISKGQTHEQ